MSKNVGEADQHNNQLTNIMFTKAFAVSLAALAGSIGIGLLGSKAAEATGRNPGAATSILVISIILAALIEGIFILTAFAVPF
jgi:F-type H+-transporting ATPase subunit c